MEDEEDDFTVPTFDGASHEDKAQNVFAKAMAGASASGARIAAAVSVGADGTAQIFFLQPPTWAG